MGWEIKIGGTRISGDSPDQAVKDAANQAVQTVQTVAEAVKTGNPEKVKEAVGELVLNNSLATLGAKQAAKEIFPELAPDQFERIVGAGVLTFVSSENVVLTVVSVADEFYAEYNMATKPPPAGPPKPVPAGQAARTAKTYSVECLSLSRWKRDNGEVELWAGFSEAPVFVAEDGSKFTWPKVDIKEGDTVNISASTNDLPDTGTGKNSFTVPAAKGLYKFPSSDTPGMGANQITKTLVFDFVA
jgi:hypothetical protein